MNKERLFYFWHCLKFEILFWKCWDCWAPGVGLGNQAPGLATFHILREKTSSLNRKPELLSSSGHRLMRKAVCNQNCSLCRLTHRAEAFPGPFSQLALQMCCGIGLPRADQVCSVQFSSVVHWCQTLCDPMDCSMLVFPVHNQLLERVQTLVHPVSDAIQPSHPLSSPSPPVFNPYQHQGLSQWASSS